MFKDTATASTGELAGEVGDAHSTPGSCPPPATADTPPVASRSLDRRLNPNAPVFVPDFKASQVAKKLFDELSTYTRWSTASSEDICYAPRYESIWRESSIQRQQVLPHPGYVYSLDPGEDEVVELEFDEVQAMNIGAEAYDPKLGSTSVSQAMEVRETVGDVEEPLDEEKRNGFKNRHSARPAKKCCLVM
ncbi:uncharacterized protein LOC6732585 [Drosophila simulans]|uniref:GD21883 n=1 Tax=Drosophila simulans TaxID=7240 RepID=B4Q7V6_DROSI|nr:uncharacterized protein LOC6732585 [Drosophila simulans]XP_016025272.1 uncharacterized protein LOC6732585 [Drosophila simulans]EDX05289.1 GD21883 [Drosophila simulans]KMY90649.1 uncharacterized protein Dsimw501_GD21883, isoform A [Drosophila simulans]KMY90650.1 uncharacterized protein Dsimw501_GD21883, isoform B [Drosophila simulans]